MFILVFLGKFSVFGSFINGLICNMLIIAGLTLQNLFHNLLILNHKITEFYKIFSNSAKITLLFSIFITPGIMLCSS